MSISRITILPGDGSNHRLQSSVDRSEAEAFSFKEILQKTSQNRTNGDTKDIPSVSKSQLIDILNDIKNKMDTKLMSALSMETSEVSDFPPSMHLVDPFIQQQLSLESDMSNKWHTIPYPDTSGDRTNIERIITQAAKTYGIDEALIKSVIKVESNFDSSSVSPKGAMGLMQLMPKTAHEMGVQNPYDPVQNVDAGTRYLKMLLNRYDGNVSLSLAAYNWGMGNLERRPDQMPMETRQYVDKVTDHYERLKG